ncbi:twin-arginine translocase subunit TatC [Cellulomonas sp. URHD0024]|uniref:twin-arginine translocase subunit TatC n=1 Tax=Cellulomonas sp. URHD0024 TaxID=1302620 RepID=UPI0003FC99EC|nr:twin-arginine translocase subunit TatC [Cellulomonas sp. URHD0024]
MPLRAHLVELRHRLFLAVLGILVGAVIGWFLYTPVFQALQSPILEVAKQRDALITLNFPGLAASFDMQIKVSFFLGVLISSPWWIYQLWAFITPGLTRKERGYAFGFVGVAVPLFLTGAYLAWWALPNAVRLLTGFTPSGAANFIDAQVYLGFVMRLMLAFGLAFLLPVVMVALNFAGIGTAAMWRRSWRWAVMAAFVFAAVMTPTPDAITMLMVALPICGLYFLALLVCELHDRRVNKQRLANGLPTLDGYLPDDAPGGTA